MYVTKSHDHAFVQEIELTPLLGTSGDTKWTITSGIDGKTQPTVVPSATDLDKTVELTVPPLKLKHIGRSDGDEPMTIAGPIVARGCGVAPSANVQPRPQPKRGLRNRSLPHRVEGDCRRARLRREVSSVAALATTQSQSW